MAGEVLRCTAGRLAGQELPIGGGMTFGRNAGEPGALGGDNELSRTHAQLTRDGAGRLVLEDLAHGPRKLGTRGDPTGHGASASRTSYSCSHARRPIAASSTDRSEPER